MVHCHVFSFIYIKNRNSPGSHDTKPDPPFCPNHQTREFPSIWLCQGPSFVFKSGRAAIRKIWMDFFFEHTQTSLLIKSFGLGPIHAEKGLLSRYPVPLANISGVELLHTKAKSLLPPSLSLLKDLHV